MYYYISAVIKEILIRDQLEKNAATFLNDTPKSNQYHKHPISDLT